MATLQSGENEVNGNLISFQISLPSCRKAVYGCRLNVSTKLSPGSGTDPIPAAYNGSTATHRGTAGILAGR